MDSVAQRLSVVGAGAALELRGVTRLFGALIFVLLRTFALDVLIKFGLDGNRFRLLIGLGFLAIVFWSSDGVIGLWERWRRRSRTSATRSGGDRHG